jgi:hypothetical protein
MYGVTIVKTTFFTNKPEGLYYEESELFENRALRRITWTSEEQVT